MIYDLKNWPVYHYGTWKEVVVPSPSTEELPWYKDYIEQLPSIKDYVDIERNSKYDMIRLEEYLNCGHCLSLRACKSRPSLFTGEPIYGNLKNFSDGKWFYPSTLIYYIKNNHLAIPDAWYDEIVKNNFVVPKLTKEELEVLKKPKEIDFILFSKNIKT